MGMPRMRLRHVEYLPFPRIRVAKPPPPDISYYTTQKNHLGTIGDDRLPRPLCRPTRSPRETNMKVTALITLAVDRYNYVKVETDEGITGVGELHPASGTGGTPFVPRAAVDYCSEYLVGKDPLHIEKHWQHMFRRQLFRGGADMMAAMGAIDIALWDIKGKSLGKPVYELLGGPVREKVRLYTHLGGNSPEELAQQASARVEEGFTALRIYPFGDFGAADFEEGLGLERMSFSGMQNNAVERVAAVREAAGPDIDIMIDVVNRLTPAEAIGLGRALEPFNLYFFEDPIEPEN
ncbi:MAG TPA: mandelate racemase/muconate lactonizing enzyme family protein, partial [Candidatus Handelsmanbacteria bacterium]|nr:mandelate racemase/muconate lactonizing enzyme family protein [Candidatus Handelsmanbacteria bacterium]